MQSLVDNLSLFNYRELLVSVLSVGTTAGSCVALLCTTVGPRLASLVACVCPLCSMLYDSHHMLYSLDATDLLPVCRWGWLGSWCWRCASLSAASTAASFIFVPLARCWCAPVPAHTTAPRAIICAFSLLAWPRLALACTKQCLPSNLRSRCIHCFLDLIHIWVCPLQVTIISIATMNLGKYYKPPYNIGVVGNVRSITGLLACLLWFACT
jgi:hypothetical protein